MSNNKIKIKGNGKLSHLNISSIPDSEVLERPIRRKFSADYKLKILQEADTLSTPGDLGALLRREGLYASNMAHEQHSCSQLQCKQKYFIYKFNSR